MPAEKFDAIVVGAGPSGNACAFTLASHGLKVLQIERGEYALPSLAMLAEPKKTASKISDDALEQNARLLEGVFDDFGVKGEIINVRPGPVVTLYELEPAPGVKSSRVIGLADDIASSMSAISARVAVVQGRNAIGVDLTPIIILQVALMPMSEMPASEEYERGTAQSTTRRIDCGRPRCRGRGLYPDPSEPAVPVEQSGPTRTPPPTAALGPSTDPGHGPRAAATDFAIRAPSCYGQGGSHP